MSQPLRVDPRERNWMIVKQWALDELRDCRLANDNKSLDKVDTAVLRGRILQLKKLLDLGQPPREPTDPEPELPGP